MVHQQSSLLLSGCLTVTLMALTVYGGEEECVGLTGQGPNTCYECSADYPGHFCGENFNESHPELETIACSGYCVKWYRQTLDGKYYMRRTCSKNLQISMRINVVCMAESRPSSGKLCFCDKDKCNAATTTCVSAWSFLALLAFLHGLVKIIGVSENFLNSPHRT